MARPLLTGGVLQVRRGWSVARWLEVTPGIRRFGRFLVEALVIGGRGRSGERPLLWLDPGGTLLLRPLEWTNRGAKPVVWRKPSGQQRVQGFAWRWLWFWCWVGGVNFWMLLALSLAVLWLQANAIACAALHALRQEARVRWEALLSLEKCLLERRVPSGMGVPPEILRWSSVLEKTRWPEDALGVRVFFEERRLVGNPDPLAGCEVLELRCREAVCRYAEAAALYNGRLPLWWGWPLSRWMGFLPVGAPPPRAGLD